jgi:MerR family regulatory protein
MMSDSERAGSGELVAIPRLAERVGVTPRVLRYWEEQGLISPTREHGKLARRASILLVERLGGHDDQPPGPAPR